MVIHYTFSSQKCNFRCLIFFLIFNIFNFFTFFKFKKKLFNNIFNIFNFHGSPYITSVSEKSLLF
jgi:hypothetical protein